MTRTVTITAVKRIITKGLTGWEAGKLMLQDVIDCYYGRDSVLTEADIDAIRHARMEGADVRDYNMFMALCRGFHMGYILGEWTCTDACLHISSLDRLLEEAEKRRTVELFESFGPRVVTRKQYEDIVAAQKEKKLAFEFSLGYMIEERFYAIAPDGVREEIDDLGLDIESAEEFMNVTQDKYDELYGQAVAEIRKLCTTGKLKPTYYDEDAETARSLLNKWKKKALPVKETVKLVDVLFVTGEELYNCDELPEWKDYVDRYQQYLFGDEDERFQHVYAVLDHCPEVWLAENGDYEGLGKPSEWITRRTESFLGLSSGDKKPKKSIKTVGAILRDKLDTAEQNIRFFLGVKTILDAAAEAVGLDVPSNEGVLMAANVRLDAFISLYNMRLKKLSEKRKPWESAESRLEKTLKMLPAIDPEKLRPSPAFLRQLKRSVLDCPQGEEWLRTKIFSLEYDDDFSFDRTPDG
jgi:hypothetical protein